MSVVACLNCIAIPELEYRGMEGIPVRTVIPSATRRVPTQNRNLRFAVRAKLSPSDFQGTHVTISVEIY